MRGRYRHTIEVRRPLSTVHHLIHVPSFPLLPFLFLFSFLLLVLFSSFSSERLLQNLCRHTTQVPTHWRLLVDLGRWHIGSLNVWGIVSLRSSMSLGWRLILKRMYETVYQQHYRMCNRNRYRTRWWTEPHCMCYLTCHRVRNRTYYRVTGPITRQNLTPTL